MKYTIRMHGTDETFSADSDDEAREFAIDWILNGDYDPSCTVWLRGWLSSASGDEEPIDVKIDPHEPKCGIGKEHHWEAPHDVVGGLKENPGVFGHGGGVITHDVCTKCGCSRTQDTWATNPETGEHGLSISYSSEK